MSKETGEAVLTANTSSDYNGRLDVAFYLGESVELTDENVKVYTGSTEEIEPDNIIPGQSGTLSEEILSEASVTDGTNPYQLYEFTLTPEQAQAPGFRIGWTGEMGHEVTAYVYTSSGEWSEVGYAAGDGEKSIDMNIPNQNVVQDGKLYLLLLRAVTVSIEERTGFIPDKGQYDFTIFWNSDTQYYAQAYPYMHKEQQQYIADIFAGQKRDHGCGHRGRGEPGQSANGISMERVAGQLCAF